MPKGRCTNFDGPCPKYESEEIIEVPEGADFVCPECDRELMVTDDGGSGGLGSLKRAGKPVLLGTAALLFLGGLGYGGYSLVSGGSSTGDAQAAKTSSVENAPARPSPEAAFAALEEDISGYALASDPTFAGRDGEGQFTYDVTLRPKAKRYSVPVVDFTPPDGWDDAGRELSQHLVLHDALPTGKTYDAAAKSERGGATGRVEAQWTGRFEASEGAWRYAGDGTLDLAETEMPEASSGEAVLTVGALDEAERERKEAVQQFEQRWQRLTQRVQQRRASLKEGLPPPCTKDTDPLIRQITRLSTDRCPNLSGEERKQCYLKVQKLNSKLGDCETRNQVRLEARRSMRGKVARYRREQVDALRKKLKETAAAHDQSINS